MIRMGEKRVRKKEMETWKRMKKGRMYCQRWVWRGTYQYLRKMKAWGLLCFYYITPSLSFHAYFLLSAANSSLQLLKSRCKDTRKKIPLHILVWKRLESFSHLTRMRQPIDRLKRSLCLWPILVFGVPSILVKQRGKGQGHQQWGVSARAWRSLAYPQEQSWAVLATFPRGCHKPLGCCW